MQATKPKEAKCHTKFAVFLFLSSFADTAAARNKTKLAATGVPKVGEIQNAVIRMMAPVATPSAAPKACRSGCS